jgi:hypothetical protein
MNTAAAADILLANAEANGCTRPGTNILDGKLIAQVPLPLHLPFSLHTLTHRCRVTSSWLPWPLSSLAFSTSFSIFFFRGFRLVREANADRGREEGRYKDLLDVSLTGPSVAHMKSFSRS